MGSLRYLNSILTILTVVMTLQLWTVWTGSGSPTPTGSPPPLSPTQAWAEGIPDAGAQRKQMVDLLKQLVQESAAQTKMFKNGEARVRVEGKQRDPE